MDCNDPENLGELICQLLTPQELESIQSQNPETTLRDIPGVRENAILHLGWITVGQLLQVLPLIPIYYPDTPVANHVLKTLEKGIINGSLSGVRSKICQEFARQPVTELATEILEQITEEGMKKIAQQSGKEVTGETAKEIVKEIIEEGLKKAGQEGVEEVAEEAAKKIATEIAEESLKKSVKQGGKEVAEEAAKQGAKRGAIFGTLIFGAIVEGVSFAASCYSAKKRLKKGKITKLQYNRHWVKRGGGAIGSLACSTAGAAFGTVAIPIPFVGSFVGSVVGGVVGDFVGNFLGSKASEQLYC